MFYKSGCPLLAANINYVLEFKKSKSKKFQVSKYLNTLKYFNRSRYIHIMIYTLKVFYRECFYL